MKTKTYFWGHYHPGGLTGYQGLATKNEHKLHEMVGKSGQGC